jgi:hypothetical protein
MSHSDEAHERGTYKITGTVRLSDGVPAAGVKIEVFDRDLRAEQFLGQCPTDIDGSYVVQYSATQFRRREKASADLVVKVFAGDGVLLAASPILFNAPLSAEVDVTIPAERIPPPTLFERITREFEPLLGELKAEQLEEDDRHHDASFLSGETGLSKNAVARFILAHKLTHQAVVPEFWFALLGSAYEFNENQTLQEQFSRTLDAMASFTVESARRALTVSFNEKEIPEALRNNVERWIEAFLRFLTTRTLGTAERPTFAGSALLDAGIDNTSKQEKFARLLNENKAFTPALAEALAQDTRFTRAEIADLQTSFQLGDITRGNFSVVATLKRAFDVRQPERIRGLAKNSEREWVTLIKESHDAGEITLPIEVLDISEAVKLPAAEVYGTMLERQFREAFPTAAFQGGLERALNNGGAHGLQHAQTLARFLERHHDFELMNTSLDDFLENSLHSDFRALARDEDFKLELKALQRVFKVAPMFDASDALLADGLHSAQKIYRMGESEFVRRYSDRGGFTAETARRAWYRSADTHAAVLTIVGDFKALEAEGLPLALKNDNDALSRFPNWNNLFQAGDLCECEHCRSVLGPAAYFADLLMFLKERETHTGHGKVKEVLFRRRPDLGYLELNCDNALITLPYVDVVCEVLEAVIAAGENDVELVGFTVVPPGAAAAKAAVAAALAAQNISLGADFSLSQVDLSDPDRWVAHGDDVTYLLKKKATANFFAEILPNTKASAAELRAYPQYVNPKAYGKLKSTRYPLALPFDLFAEEVRAAFQKCGLQRWDLMRSLRGAAAPNNPTDGDIAAEYFAISSDAAATIDEKRLILVAAPTVAAQQAVWGETGANWLTVVGNVKNFLQKTGLEYNELLALLDLKFINPAGDVAINHLDASCDTDQKVIQVLDATKLDRIHRFLRLWRKLPAWKMWELDLAIRQPRIGNGVLDETFLVRLLHLSEVQKKLGPKTSIEQTCALFGNLNVETRFTKLHEKRQDALYQTLFLNKRLIKPLDPAFEVASVNVPAPTVEKIPPHASVVLAALSIRETDLALFGGLTKASDGLPYITNDLTLANLSFLWRHAWLAKQLKYKPEEWRILLKLFNQDLPDFASPETALEFLETIDQLKNSGFTTDELNWLVAADPSAKAAMKEADAALFLSGLRKELKSIQADTEAAQYDFLVAQPPTDVDRLTTLVTSLLQQLNRDEAAAQFFIDTLRDEIVQEAAIGVLPAGFTFPATITGAPNRIPIRYEPVLRFTGTMTAAQRTTLLTDPALAAVTGFSSYQQAIQDLFQQPGQTLVTGLPAGFSFPATITGAPNHIPIRYEPVIRLNGVLTAAQRSTLFTDASLAAVTGLAAYQDAIETLFITPRLALKFFEPVFTAPLANLPAAVDFKTLGGDLASQISYDAEQRLLRFAGILTKEEKDALDALSANLSYRGAVNSLFTQPVTGAFPPDKIWLEDPDLLFPLRDLNVPANDNLAKNLATAITQALSYLAKTLSENAVVRQISEQLGLTEPLTDRLVRQYALLPDTLMVHLTGAFRATTGVVDYATLKTTFDAWFWANRVAALWKKWKISLAEWERIDSITVGASLLDFITLPLDEFLRTSRVFRLRDTLPERDITFLEVLENLERERVSPGTYVAATFAVDVERLSDNWVASDVATLVGGLDLVYPQGYLLAENWERLRRAFQFLGGLNAGAATSMTFAAATMNTTHAKKVKELLRSKFGSETWLTLCSEIQDVLRERKRDALAAYLLTLPLPADAPSGKWENTNDLYAYYLLDVEMAACQLTSRLVQASGSVQLFVQRCFMGLEPHVKVKADGVDGDSAWRWWKWMRKYRVWEANRKVFLWPENWIEPELKKDRSQFFKDLEDELLQNEVDQYSVENAFSNYLEKLDAVAQLEIAGFYQEDDGDNAIVHVFGRNAGAEPHLYYYRRYDYRQWTPWETVELDIQSDYLIPAVLNKRLFLFWPAFTEIPDEAGNSTADGSQVSKTNAPVPKTKKKLKMQMAVSEYRKGKWTPRRLSKDFEESSVYDEEIFRRHYFFIPIDATEVDGRFGILYGGSSERRLPGGPSLAVFRNGAFELGGCGGVPEQVPPDRTLSTNNYGVAFRVEFPSVGDQLEFAKWAELPERTDRPQDDFTLLDHPTQSFRSDTIILEDTPGFFGMSPPFHLSYFDKLLLDGNAAFGLRRRDVYVPFGMWLPYFYNDNNRTFFVLPMLGGQPARDREPNGAAPVVSPRVYYPDLKKAFRLWENYFDDQLQAWVDSLDLTLLTPAQRDGWEAFLHLQFPELPPPKYTDRQFRDFTKRFYMRFVHLFLGGWAMWFFRSTFYNPTGAVTHVEVGILRRFHFKNFYHPFACDFAKLVHNPLKGVPALMTRETQLKNSGFDFFQSYRPTAWVVSEPAKPKEIDSYPDEIVDFSPDGAYSPYNWELFFHAPLLIANSLSKNQRFEEARDWYHFIFNPIGVESAAPGGSAMSKYWITKPFFETMQQDYIQQRIENIMRMLAGDASVPGFSAQAKKDLEDQVLDWRTNPFEPHRIANYRTVAYQKTVVMKYLENLIAWGDYLFRQDSMESINEATQLYILAAEILGPKPKKIPPRAKPPVESFNELEKEFDKFSNALIELENLIPPMPGNGPDGGDPAPLLMLYFCIPQNEKMLAYWDTVADRLYKIRHCMNIEGVVRQLPLFEPPIDPGLLVKAVAGGLDIGAAVADLNAPLPLYRFDVLLQKANTVCADLKALGGALLMALEKKDAEELALLRQGQEIRLLEAVKALREQQIEEAKQNLEGAKKNKEVVTVRRDYYLNIEKQNKNEILQQSKLYEVLVFQQIAQVMNVAASVANLVPSIDIGAAGIGGSPRAGATFGGPNVAGALQAYAGAIHFLANIESYNANKASIQAGQDRRWDDWKFQERLANKELEQIDKQIAAAELRVAMAEKERDNHAIQIENAKATDAFMRSKYTNQALYQWQIGQISGVYFQTYKLAHDLAKRAERCFRFEVGLKDSSYIQFGYWDSLKKGLLAGEKLQYDLRRLEVAHIEQNRREYELTKHVSLAMLDPLALVRLRETGRCFFNVPEELYDLDYAGHYFRRIKSVSLTLPCVAGPYTTTSCTLRLLKSSIRVNTTNGDNGYPRNTDDQGVPADDGRFVENSVPVKSIAASTAQADSGLFELNFRDERYLPFEGAGAISSWSLELFNDAAADFGKPLRQFDYSTIADALIHIKYTAREDAGAFKNGAVAHLRDYFSQDGAAVSVRMFNLRQEFPSQWHRFLHPSNSTNGNLLDLEVSQSLFPLRDTGKTLKVNSMVVLARCTDPGTYTVAFSPPLPPPPPLPAPDPNAIPLVRVNQYGGLHFNQKDVSALTVEIQPGPSTKWQLRMKRPGNADLLPDEVQDVFLILGYEWD